MTPGQVETILDVVEHLTGEINHLVEAADVLRKLAAVSIQDMKQEGADRGRVTATPRRPALYVVR